MPKADSVTVDIEDVGSGTTTTRFEQSRRAAESQSVHSAIVVDDGADDSYVRRGAPQSTAPGAPQRPPDMSFSGRHRIDQWAHKGNISNLCTFVIMMIGLFIKLAESDRYVLFLVIFSFLCGNQSYPI